LSCCGKSKRIEKQLEHFSKIDTEIIFVLGFDSEKIYDYVSKYKVVHNDGFEQSNSLKNVMLGLRVCSNNEAIIINGNNIYSSHYFTAEHSCWGGITKTCHNIGVNVSETIEHFNFGLKTGWSDIVYLNEHAVKYIKTQKFNDKTNVMFDFELYNKMIDNGIQFEPREVIYE
jgi:hypothetical protein